MPTTTTAQIASVIELLLALAGLVLLWRTFLRRKPEQGDTTQPPPVPALSGWAVGGLDLAMLLWLVLCGGIIMQIGGMALLQYLGIKGPELLIMVSSIFQFGMLAGCLGFARFTAAGKKYDFPRGGFVKAGVATFLISLGPVFAVGMAWQALLKALDIPIDQQEMIGLFRNTKNIPMLGFMMLLATIMAPLSEELIFRGGVFRFLHGRVPHWRAVLLSALFFGVIHMNLASFPQLSALGVVFALAYARTGNVAVPMLAHALFNLNTILIILAGIDA